MMPDDAYRWWPQPEDCHAAIAAARWPNGTRCPFCDGTKISRHAEQGRPSRLQCSACRRSFLPTAGTVLQHAKGDVQQWIMLAHLMGKVSKLTSVDAARLIGSEQPRAWRMMKRLRTATPDDWALLRAVAAPLELEPA